MQPANPPFYHERQRLFYCGVHALNNFFQRSEVSVSEFESIARSLSDSLFNEHRSVLRLGNYDVNVITMALAKRNFEVSYFDMRRPIRDLFTVPFDALLLNFRRKSRFIPWKRTNHWVTVLPYSHDHNTSYWNCDSLLDEPECLSKDELTSYLQDRDSLSILFIRRSSSVQ
ncbi:hypothetical protein RCL1_000332 [Eukaryota sp. TZLM3-RCL]